MNLKYHINPILHKKKMNSSCNCYLHSLMSSSLFLDIDECSNSSTNDCDQMCTNTAGSYLCRCGRGFTLDQDGKHCNGMLVYQYRVLSEF